MTNVERSEAMELMDAIYHRRAVRDYTAQEVPRATLLELLHAAAQAPSAMNRQPWAFCIFQGAKRLKAYSDRIKLHLLSTRSPRFEVFGPDDMLADPAYNVFYNASTLVVICAKATEFDPAEDCCLAAQNLMLAAHSLGLATCPIGFARSWLNLREVKEELGIPLDLTPVFPLILGYPAGRISDGGSRRNEPTIAVWMTHDA